MTLKELYDSAPLTGSNNEILIELKRLKDVASELYEALDDATSVFDEMDSRSWNDDSGWQHSSYEIAQNFVNETLEKHKSVKLAGGA